MKRVEMYMLEEVGQKPTLDDIKECVRIADERNCIVQLHWVMPYSGKFIRNILPGEDALHYFNKYIPKRYSV